MGATPAAHTASGKINASLHRNKRSAARTYVVFVTLHVVCKSSPAELVGAEEAEVARHLSGYGGGQSLEEPLRSLVPHDGFHHRPNSASEKTDTNQAQLPQSLSYLATGVTPPSQ